MSDPISVINCFYAAEADYMNAGGAGSNAGFDAVAATLDPEVVLHQSPDLPWGGEYHGHDGYAQWARAMSEAFDQLAVKEQRYFVDQDTVVITCRLVTRSRATGKTLDLPMVQIVRTRGDRILEFRPFYWNVPAYCAAVSVL